MLTTGRSLNSICPDYNLRWLLMTDASDYACGGVLIQIAISGEGVELFQVNQFNEMVHY